MALNIELDSSNEPKRRESEYFILRRRDIEFEIKLDTRKYQTSPFIKGNLLLTTQRLILLNNLMDDKQKIKAYEIPLAQLSNEKYEQPKMSENYYTGKVESYQDVPEDEPPVQQEFKVWFQKGSCNKFIMCIKTCL